jgi:hypothetical protein
MTALAKTLPEVLGHVGAAIGCLLLLVIYRKLTRQEMDREDIRLFVRLFGAATIVFVIGDFLHLLYRLLYPR